MKANPLYPTEVPKVSVSTRRAAQWTLAAWITLTATVASAQDPLYEGTSSAPEQSTEQSTEQTFEQNIKGSDPELLDSGPGRVHSLSVGLDYAGDCATNDSVPWSYGVSDTRKIHALLERTVSPGGSHELLVGKDVDALKLRAALDSMELSSNRSDDLILYMAVAPGLRGSEYTIKLCGSEISVSSLFSSIESRGFDRVVLFFAGPHAYKVLRGYMDYSDDRPVGPSRGADDQHEGYSASARSESLSRLLFAGPNNDFEVEDLGGSVFTYYLGQALEGAAYRTRNRALTARGCVDYVSDRLDSMSVRTMYLTTYASTSDVVINERSDYTFVQPEVSDVEITNHAEAASFAQPPATGWLGLPTSSRGVSSAVMRSEDAGTPKVQVRFKVTAVHDVERVLVNGVEATKPEEGTNVWTVELDVRDDSVREAIDRYQGVFIVATDVQSNTGINLQPFDTPTLPEARRSYALVIGTDDYDDPSWTSLQNPVLDATTVGERLANDYGFEVEVLQNPTRGALRTKLTEYKKREYGPRDQLLIYIAGHGYFDEDLEIGHLVTTDAPSPERIGTDWSMTYSELTTIADRIDVHQKLLILDVCFGGSAFVAGESSRASVYDAPTRQAQITHHMEFRAQNVLTAGGKVRVSDGLAGQHSPFARRLLAALATRGNKHGVLTFSSLYTRVEDSNPTPVRGTFGTRHDPGGQFTFVANTGSR